MSDFVKIYVKRDPDDGPEAYIGADGRRFSLAVVLAKLFEVTIGDTPFLLGVHLALKGSHYVVSDVRSGCVWPNSVKPHHYEREDGRKATLVEAARAHVEQEIRNAARNGAGPVKVAANLMTWAPIRDTLVAEGYLEPDEIYPDIK